MKTQTYEAAKEKKTVRVDAFARVLTADTACIGCMAWESPRVIFQLDDGRQIIWHSEHVDVILNRAGITHGYDMRGKDFGVSMRVRYDRVWRMDRIYAL